MWVAAVKLGPTPELVAALTLVKDLSHVTKIADSQHAREAMIKKFHPEYLLMTLIARSIVSMLNLFLPRKTAVEKMVEKLEASFKQLRKKNSMEATQTKCIPFPVRCLIDTSSCMSTSKWKASVKALN